MMKNIKYVLMLAVATGFMSCSVENDRTPVIEEPKMPQMSELPKLEPPTPVDIDSLKAEIEATKFRLPELNLTKLSE